MSDKKLSVTELGNPRKPHGDAGAEMLEGMNERHFAVTGWALGFFDFDENDRVLDIGCGGGETIRRMSEKMLSANSPCRRTRQRTPFSLLTRCPS